MATNQVNGGATRTIPLSTLLDEMKRCVLESGLITLCIGARMGAAAIIERI